jgi:hypothetical protein
MSKKYIAEIGVLEHIWENRTVEVIAKNEKEARENIEDHNYVVVSAKMGDLEESNMLLVIESIEVDS